MKYYADDGNVYHCSELDFYKHDSKWKWAFQGKFINGKISNEKCIIWYKEGQRHREDGPAVEYANGSKEWWLNGKLHRENGPAIEYINGDKFWYINGEYHREDGPAVEYSNGVKLWYKNGIHYEPTEHLKKLYKAGNL